MRQFILNGQKIKNGLINIEGKDYRYLRQVLRIKIGDMLSVRLEDGSLCQTTVAKVDEKAHSVLLQICGDSGNRTITRGVQADELCAMEDAVEFWLIQFVTKPQKLELIVRQATECGVKKILLVEGEFSEKSSLMALGQEGSKKDRLERIIKEARQQSGSPVNTEVFGPMSLDSAIELWNSNSDNKNQLGFVLYERTEQTEELKKVIENIGKENIKRSAVCCGCEGGISPSEIEKLCKKGLFHPIHFTVNILRAETAALYGLAVVQSNIL